MTVRDPLWMNANASAQPDYSAADDRVGRAALLAPGAAGSLLARAGVMPGMGDDLAPSVDGLTPGSWEVATGVGSIAANLSIGNYLVCVDAVEDGAIAAAGAVQRTDRLILRARDGEIDAAAPTTETRDAIVEYLEGDPGTGAAQPVPDHALLIGDITVPVAGTPTLQDKRVWQSRAGMVGVPVKDKAARDLLPPVAGLACFRLDTAKVEFYDGTNWELVDPVQRERKTANQVVNNSIALVDDVHLKFDAEANTSYLLEMMLLFSGGASAMDARVGLGLPSGTWDGGAIRPDVDIAAGTHTGLTVWTANTDLTNGVMVGGVPASGFVPGIWTFKASVHIGAVGGIVSMRWAQNVATAQDLTLRSGSWLRAERF